MPIMVNLMPITVSNSFTYSHKEVQGHTFQICTQLKVTCRQTLKNQAQEEELN